MMISAKKLIKMARRWRRMAGIGRKRISLPGNTTGASKVAQRKGHFVVYTVDEKRFEFPIAYLNTCIFRELLVKSEEEFGLPSNGPIRLPCDASFVNFAASCLIQRRATLDMEKALLLSLENNRCSSFSSVYRQETSQELLACVF